MKTKEIDNLLGRLIKSAQTEDWHKTNQPIAKEILTLVKREKGQYWVSIWKDGRLYIITENTFYWKDADVIL